MKHPLRHSFNFLYKEETKQKKKTTYLVNVGNQHPMITQPVCVHYVLGLLITFPRLIGFDLPATWQEIGRKDARVRRRVSLMDDVAAVASAASACVCVRARRCLTELQSLRRTLARQRTSLFRDPDHLASRNRQQCVQHLRNPIFIW